MVCLLTPSSRPTSAALRPASICFNAPIISTSLYFLLDMPPPPRRMRKSYILVRRFGGAGQFHPTITTFRFPGACGTVYATLTELCGVCGVAEFPCANPFVVAAIRNATNWCPQPTSLPYETWQSHPGLSATERQF